MKKGTELISSVLIVILVLAAVIIIYKVVAPKIRKMKSITYFEEGKDTLNTMSSTISSLSLESSGARRILNLNVPEGGMHINSKDNTIVYRFHSYAKIIDLGSMLKEGNLLITSGQGVKAYTNGSEYILENGNVLISFKKIGNSTNYGTVNLSDIINYVKINNVKYYPKVSVKIDHNSESTIGNGYTEFLNEGDFMNYGEFLAHIRDSSKPYNYTVIYTLGTGWDFVTVEVKDIEEN